MLVREDERRPDLQDVVVAAGAAAQGQGTRTMLAQLAADALGVHPDAIHVTTGDTGASPLGHGAYASRQAVTAGNALNIAARMEEAAKTHNIACAISGDVAENLLDEEARLIPIGHEKMRGSAVEIPIYEYRVAGEGGTNTVRRVPARASPSGESGSALK